MDTLAHWTLQDFLIWFVLCMLLFAAVGEVFLGIIDLIEHWFGDKDDEG